MIYLGIARVMAFGELTRTYLHFLSLKFCLILLSKFEYVMFLHKACIQTDGNLAIFYTNV